MTKQFNQLITSNHNSHKQLPETGFVRLPQIIGTEAASSGKRKHREYYPPLIPISRAGWWLGIKNGIYPKGIKISSTVTAWRVSDIKSLIERLDGNIDPTTGAGGFHE